MQITLDVEGEDQAVALMVHHLQAAAALFELTPIRLDRSFCDDHGSGEAMAAWLDAMEEAYPA